MPAYSRGFKHLTTLKPKPLGFNTPAKIYLSQLPKHAQFTRDKAYLSFIINQKTLPPYLSQICRRNESDVSVYESEAASR